jgi:fibronectin-binding autotransporter adhesin
MTTYTAPPTQNNLVLNSGDHLNVDATGQAFDTSIHNGGVESVLSGGESYGTTIDNGGLELVFAGGKDIETTVNSGGREFVDGESIRPTINDGGVIHVINGEVYGATVNYGGREVVSGGTSTDADIRDGGLEVVENGGSSTGTTIFNGGREDVRGGTSANTTIHYGGLEVVYNGGIATSTTIANGVETVREGGQADAITFEGSHGTLNLTNPAEFADGTVNNWHVGDVIDFVNTTGLTLYQASGTLLVETSGGAGYYYFSKGQQANTAFKLVPDGHGGTDLVLTPPVVGVADSGLHHHPFV